MVYWDAFVDNEYSSFTDEITFDIAPKPYVPNPPAPQPQPGQGEKPVDGAFRKSCLR